MGFMSTAQFLNWFVDYATYSNVIIFIVTCWAI